MIAVKGFLRELMEDLIDAAYQQRVPLRVPGFSGLRRVIRDVRLGEGRAPPGGRVAFNLSFRVSHYRSAMS